MFPLSSDCWGILSSIQVAAPSDWVFLQQQQRFICLSIINQLFGDNTHAHPQGEQSSVLSHRQASLEQLEVRCLALGHNGSLATYCLLAGLLPWQRAPGGGGGGRAFYFRYTTSSLCRTGGVDVSSASISDWNNVPAIFNHKATLHKQHSKVFQRS